MGTQANWLPCWDDYPDWVVTITFDDKTTLKMVTNGSNIYFYGGPWQTEIDKQNYTQYSGAFLDAMVNINKALKLSMGKTAAMGCGGLPDPLSLAFGTPEPSATQESK
jgi:hypothetical protein